MGLIRELFIDVNTAGDDQIAVHPERSGLTGRSTWVSNSSRNLNRQVPNRRQLWRQNMIALASAVSDFDQSRNRLLARPKLNALKPVAENVGMRFGIGAGEG